MKKLIVALVAGFMSLAVAGAYAADDKKGDAKKSDTGMTKSEKGMAKSADAGTKDDDKKKSTKKDSTTTTK
jgi:hypothetical protein